MVASWYFANNEPDEALPYAEEAMELANALGNTSLASMARFALGGALMVRDPQRARHLLLESIELGNQVGNDFFVGMALGRIARIGSDASDPLWARQFRDAIDTAVNHDDRRNAVVLLDVHIQALLTTGRDEPAALLFGYVQQHARPRRQPVLEIGRRKRQVGAHGHARGNEGSPRSAPRVPRSTSPRPSTSPTPNSTVSSLRLGEVEPNGEQVGAEAPNVGGVHRPTEGIESRFGVVSRNDLGVCVPPLAPEADADVRIRGDVVYVAGVAPVLGDDPAGRVLDVHPHDGAAPLSRLPSDALDQDVARHEPRSHRELCRRVHEIPLKEANVLPLALRAVTAHSAQIAGAARVLPAGAD